MFEKLSAPRLSLNNNKNKILNHFIYITMKLHSRSLRSTEVCRHLFMNSSSSSPNISLNLHFVLAAATSWFSSFSASCSWFSGVLAKMITFYDPSLASTVINGLKFDSRVLGLLGQLNGHVVATKHPHGHTSISVPDRIGVHAVFGFYQMSHCILW